MSLFTPIEDLGKWLADKIFRYSIRKLAAIHHLASMGSPPSGLMFPNSVGKPVGMQRIVADVIRPALVGSGVEWHGWHALRRGLATNLHELGVPDKIIQMILRHSNVGVTQSCYIKTTDPQAVEGMKKLEREISRATNMQPAKPRQESPTEVLFKSNTETSCFQQDVELAERGGFDSGEID